MTATVEGVSATAGNNGGGAGTWPTNGMNTVVLPASSGAPGSGDLVLLPIFVRNGAQTIDTTSGYFRLSDDNVTGTGVTAEIQGKVAGGSESNPTVTDSQTASQPTGAVALTIRGWSGVLGEIVVPTPNLGSSSTVPFPDATAAVDDSLVLRIAMQGDDNTVLTPPAGHSLEFFELTASGSDACLVIYSQDAPAAAGAVGTANLVMSGSDPYAAWTIVIPPGGGEPEPETGTLDAVLPALAGTLAAQSHADAALVGVLPLPTASMAATTVGSATAEMAATLPALAGALSSTASTRGSLSATLPALIGAFAGQVPGEGPTRAVMAAAAAARRSADSTTTARRTTAPAMTARRAQTSGVT